MLGNKVGLRDKGVGCIVVGFWVGLGLGIVDGILLGDSVGTVVGEGVVGPGVLIGVGRSVGAGVGRQVVHIRFNSFGEPPDVKPLPYTVHTSLPIGGVDPHLPDVSSVAAT